MMDKLLKRLGVKFAYVALMAFVIIVSATGIIYFRSFLNKEKTENLVDRPVELKNIEIGYTFNAPQDWKLDTDKIEKRSGYVKQRSFTLNNKNVKIYFNIFNYDQSDEAQNLTDGDPARIIFDLNNDYTKLGEINGRRVFRNQGVNSNNNETRVYSIYCEIENGKVTYNMPLWPENKILDSTEILISIDRNLSEGEIDKELKKATEVVLSMNKL